MLVDYAVKISENNFLPLREVVFNTLRYAILHGELKPGERLMEVKLADTLGVSRTPVREALKLLESEGLVVMIPRKGAVVAPIDEKTMEDVMVIRRTLEELAVKLACDTITDTQLQELKEVTEQMELAIDKNELDKITDLDVKFHDIIITATGNRKLTQLLNELREQMYRYRLEYVKYEKDHMTITKEHRAIIMSIEEKDPSLARKMVKKHIETQEEMVKQSIRDK